jgi:hypothetical protein
MVRVLACCRRFKPPNVAFNIPCSARLPPLGPPVVMLPDFHKALPPLSFTARTSMV